VPRTLAAALPASRTEVQHPYKVDKVYKLSHQSKRATARLAASLLQLNKVKEAALAR